MRYPHLLLGANWKMNKTVREATSYANELLRQLATIEGIDLAQLFLIPPFTAIAAVKQASNGKFWVGAQNMHWEECGAYTGEISAPMLRELGVDLVELGHAERRQYFNETDEAINQKVLTALQYGFRPVICLGEGPLEREYKVEPEMVGRQLKIVLRGIGLDQAAQLILAYEPLWAIGGTGTAATPKEVHRMVAHIRSVLEELFGRQAAAAIPIIYGGDVNTSNAAQLLQETGVDGLFVGRAAWEAEDFARLIRICIRATGGRKHAARDNA